MKFKTGYETKFQEDASTFGGHTYDALMILALGIEQAGLEQARVRDAIENLKGYFGTAGEFNFSPEDHNGLGLDAFTMVTVKDGSFVPFEQQ